MKQLLAETARVVHWWGPCSEDGGHASGTEREEHQPNQPSKVPGSGTWGDNIKNIPFSAHLLWRMNSKSRKHSIGGSFQMCKRPYCGQPEKPMLRVMVEHKVGWWVPGAPQAALLHPLGTCSWGGRM